MKIPKINKTIAEIATNEPLAPRQKYKYAPMIWQGVKKQVKCVEFILGPNQKKPP